MHFIIKLTCKQYISSLHQRSRHLTYFKSHGYFLFQPDTELSLKKTKRLLGVDGVRHHNGCVVRGDRAEYHPWCTLTDCGTPTSWATRKLFLDPLFQFEIMTKLSQGKGILGNPIHLSLSHLTLFSPNPCSATSLIDPRHRFRPRRTDGRDLNRRLFRIGFLHHPR